MSAQPSHGPYRPTTWSLGGRNKKDVDIPITAVFLALYVGGAATHMTIFQLNRRRNHKFIFSVLLFGFCMSRIVTTSLRLASTANPTNISLAIAAAVFVAAATLLLFVINLLWAQRILRSLHPHIGWNRYLSLFFKALYVIIGLTLAINITAVVQSNFTLRQRTKQIDRDLLLYGSTYLAIFSTLPIIIVGLALALPRRGSHDRFGSGTMRTKIIVLLIGSTLLATGAWYRCGTTWEKPVPITQPLPAYFHKAAFYIFNFGVEVMTVYLYAIVRVDLRFHIPNGAKGPGSYAAGNAQDSADEENQKKTVESEKNDERQDAS